MKRKKYTSANPRSSPRGRRSVPTALKKASKKSKQSDVVLRRGDPVVVDGAPQAPYWLPKENLKEWNECLRILSYIPGLITKVDADSVAMLACKMADVTHLRREWTRNKYSNTGKHLSILRALRQTEADFLKLLREFGMTPSARAGMVVPNQKEIEDEFEKFLGARAKKQA